MCGVVTASTAFAPIAASAADPPAARSWAPAAEARWSTEHTSPPVEYVVGQRWVLGTDRIA